MPENVTQKLIRSHRIDGEMRPGEEVRLRIDQTLTQDATGTLVMLELEAMGLDRVRTELSVQYVDHNLIQQDHRNPDDHLFLESCCRRLGVWYSPPGNGVSHPVHQQRFGRPGRTLLGSDSHTPAAGAIGMLAIGAGGLEVALAMAGEPFPLRMPTIRGIRLTGELPERVSAKDVILELLRRHGVDGAVNCVLEYYGAGLACLSAMDRHVIANMGTELGATSSVFPSDEEVRRFLQAEDRGDHWDELLADDGCSWDEHEELVLSDIEPLIAMPSSPGNVERVRDVAGEPIYQAYIGSSANPGYGDFAAAAGMVRGQRIDPQVSLDINPTSRQLLLQLMRDGHLTALIEAGGRLHQAGCNGCIGMGQAPATGRLSLRTVPRNFPGRSGTEDDRVCLVSPETAAASALRGRITDPRDVDGAVAGPPRSGARVESGDLAVAPPSAEVSREVELVRGPNIVPLPDFDALPDHLQVPVLLAVDDDVSTDEILPAGTRVLPYRSNIPKIAEFVFSAVDDSYADRALSVRDDRGHAVIGGHNYGQGSSREHAALAPRFLGLRTVIAKSFARIHRRNLINFGILPLTFNNAADHERLSVGDSLQIAGLDELSARTDFVAEVSESDIRFEVCHDLSPREVAVIQAGGLINERREPAAA